jgi:adenine deaminase
VAYPPDMGEGAGRGDLRHRLAVARGDEPADLVLAGGRVLSVFSGELLEADVAVAGEHVAGIGRYEGRETVDCSGLIVLPGFIDGHMHIESTKLTVDEFARVVLPWGTTTVVLDPHEIANVFGLRGVRALLAAADGVPLDCYVMVSSCVPASPFESSGEIITAEDIAGFLAEEPRALGVAEMMNFPAVVAGEDEALAKVEAAGRLGRHVDGHAPGLSGPALNAYVAAGVRSDHECTTAEEALEKRRLGMWIMIREGSAARNLEALLPVVLEHGSANSMLCTDDREPDQLLDEGHVGDVVRKAVAFGCPAADAVAMATLNPARYHRLHEHGAVAPGYLADLVAVEDLERFRPVRVWKRGRLAAERGQALGIAPAEAPAWMRDSVRVPRLSGESFRIPADGRVRVIGVEPGEIVTRALVAEPEVRAGEALADPARDLAKVAVVERHRGTGRIGLGFVRGFGLRRGALASTHAHDAHNLVVVGVDDADMAAAANRLAVVGGGQAAVEGGEVVGELPCPIGGLLSDRPAEQVAAAARRLEVSARGLGVTMDSPFMAMSFLALSVIPELKITDRGLVDTVRFELVPLQT